MLSLAVLNSLHIAEGISTVLKLSPTVLSNLHSSEAIPHSNDVIPPMYWTTSNVLNNLRSTEPTLYGVILVIPSVKAVLQLFRESGKIIHDLCTLTKATGPKNLVKAISYLRGN